MMIHGAPPMAEKDDDNAVRTGAAPQDVFMPVETAPPPIYHCPDPGEQTSERRRQHIRDFADQDQEHGQLIHDYGDQNTNQNGHAE